MVASYVSKNNIKTGNKNHVFIINLCDVVMYASHAGHVDVIG